MKRVKIWVGSDRAGFGLKDGVVKMLERLKLVSEE